MARSTAREGLCPHSLMLSLTKFLRDRYYLTYLIDAGREVQRLISPRASSGKLARAPPRSLSESRAPCFPPQLTDQLHIRAWCHGQGQEMGTAIVMSTATITNITAALTTALICLFWITIICKLSFPLMNCESSDGNCQSHFVPPPWHLRTALCTRWVAKRLV